ncbi:MAG: ASCH domain-containing protein, partial [Treponema sp.]|nr:ASCH domain-containing protein [Treponema sp.]
PTDIITPAHSHFRLPISGELYLVFDRGGNPRCVIEIQSVNIIPFNEVTWSMAQQEGEDQDLQTWRDKKQEYLEEEGHIVGFDFTPDIKLVFQTFKVIYR